MTAVGYQIFFESPPISVRLETMTELAYLEPVSGGYFSVLGVETVLGRGLAPDDDRPGANPAAVLSHRWWRESFVAVSARTREIGVRKALGAGRGDIRR